MKLSNFSKMDNVRRLHDNYTRAVKALAKVKELRTREDLHQSDGGVSPDGKKSLYGLHINEYEDGSSNIFTLDLTGLELHFELLGYLEVILKQRVAELEKQIEAL